MKTFQCDGCSIKCQMRAMTDKFTELPKNCPFHDLSITEWKEQPSAEEMVDELLRLYPGYQFFGEQRLSSYYGEMQVYTSFGMSKKSQGSDSDVLFIDEHGEPVEPLSKDSYEVWGGGYETDIDYIIAEIYNEVMKRRNAAK